MGMKDLINKNKSGESNGYLPKIKPIEKPKVFAGIGATGDCEDYALAKHINNPVKPKPRTLGIGINLAKNKPINTNEEAQHNPVDVKSVNSPFAGLAATLKDNKENGIPSISSILGGVPNTTPDSPIQNDAVKEPSETAIQTNKNSSPTLEDLSKFVFEEQPDDSTEELAYKFSNMLDGLSSAVGSDIPKVLSDTLAFMKENAFLVDILKPENIGELVKTMARSYGYVGNNQTQKSAKRKVKTQEQNNILNSLDGLKF